MLSINTIEGHLAYYVGTGEIPVSEFVSQEITDLIAGHFEGAMILKWDRLKQPWETRFHGATLSL